MPKVSVRVVRPDFALFLIMRQMGLSGRGGCHCRMREPGRRVLGVGVEEDDCASCRVGKQTLWPRCLCSFIRTGGNRLSRHLVEVIGSAKIGQLLHADTSGCCALK
jgi:hypothetical protein